MTKLKLFFDCFGVQKYSKMFLQQINVKQIDLFLLQKKSSRNMSLSVRYGDKCSRNIFMEPVLRLLIIFTI